MSLEQLEIKRSVDKFSDEMLSRMLEKQIQGRCGWDTLNILEIHTALNTLINKAININYNTAVDDSYKKDLIDIANYSMMIKHSLEKVHYETNKDNSRGSHLPG